MNRNRSITTTPANLHFLHPSPTTTYNISSHATPISTMTTALRALSASSSLCRSLLSRSFASSSPSSSSSTSWPHNRPSPSHFGQYAVLSSEGAMEAYPDPRPVPASIARPTYVPANYFTAPIWEHEEGGEEVGEDGVKLGTEEERGVREAGRLAGEVLAAVRKIVKVSAVRSAVELRSLELWRRARLTHSPGSRRTKSTLRCTSLSCRVARTLPHWATRTSRAAVQQA